MTLNPPQNGSFAAPLALSGTYNTNGGSAISQIQVDLTTTASAYPVNAYTATFTNNSWRYTIPAAGLTPGNYTAWATITNADGDIVPSAFSTTFNVIDNVPPVTTATPYIHTNSTYQATSASGTGVTGLYVINGGSGYTSYPNYVFFTGGGGSGSPVCASQHRKRRGDGHCDWQRRQRLRLLRPW